MNTPCIETERLMLLPMTYEFVTKLLNGDESAYELYNISPMSDWPNGDTTRILPIIKNKLKENLDSGFTSWIYIEKASQTIIGDGGFKDKPDGEGKIDLGYGVIERKRGNGYASEAARALLDWGKEQLGVKTVTADCLRQNAASYKVLKKIGMTLINEDATYAYFASNVEQEKRG